MDHLAIISKKGRLLSKNISGEKSIESRGSRNRIGGRFEEEK